jgi:hypothetical protein
MELKALAFKVGMLLALLRDSRRTVNFSWEQYRFVDDCQVLHVANPAVSCH